MAEVSSDDLRIYCLCGQKMRISRAMYGKPGKCVACRQKIRIPAQDELPEGDQVLYLKDHPEFLRKPGQAARVEAKEQADFPGDLDSDDVLLEGESTDVASVPFVLFEPITRLCNYEYKVNSQLQALRDNKPAAYDKATLMSYRGMVRKTRQQLEKRIREELIAIGSELQRIQEEITGDTLALRTGELTYIAFSKKILPQRKRRELLAYRQHNMRGWLATEDPHRAGGLEDADLTDVPVDSADVPFPLEKDIDALPIENSVLKLEEALRLREKSDKRLNELHRLNLEGGLTAEELDRLRADTEAERERARTAVAFYRARLQQVIQDCEDDSKALKAHQSLRKEQVASAEFAKDAFEALEEAVFRAQVDIKRARNMATRALNANAVSDVPNPRGTFLERLARPGGGRGLGVDSWLAWVGSALLLAVIFVPIADNVPGGNAAVFQTFTLALFAGAAIFGLAGTIMRRTPRACAMSTIWLLSTVFGAAYFQFESTNVGLAGATLRSGDPWWTSLGGLMLISGWAVAGIAVVVSSFVQPGLRWLGPVCVLGGAALAGVVLTDYAGFVQPEPGLASVLPEPHVETGNYEVQIELRNSGNRAFWLGGDTVRVPAASEYRLEQKLDGDAWGTVAGGALAVVDGAPAAFDLKGGLRVPGGSVVALSYALAPGTYRVQVIPQWKAGGAVQHTFQLEPFAVDMESFFNRPDDSLQNGGTASGTSGTATGATVELQGVINNSSNSDPIFSIIVTQPDGTVQREQYKLGDTLYGEWKISEFSPAHNSVTLTDGERLLVVDRGQPETLNQPTSSSSRTAVP